MRFLEKRPEWTYPVLAIYPRNVLKQKVKGQVKRSTGQLRLRIGLPSWLITEERIM